MADTPLNEISQCNNVQPNEKEIKNFMDRQTAINGFKQLEKISASPGQEFCVIAYFLSDEIKDDGCHGLWYLLGTYPSAKKAKVKAIKTIEKTGIPTIYATRTCSWQEINDRYQPNRIKTVPTDKDGKLRKQHEKEQKKIANQFEREKELQHELEEDMGKESDPTSIEYYIQQWFRIIKTKAAIEKLETELSGYKSTYDEGVSNLQEAYKLNPSHETNWIPRLEDRLPKRGETNILEALKLGREILQKEVLDC